MTSFIQLFSLYLILFSASFLASARDIIMIPDENTQLPALYDKESKIISIYHSNCSPEAIKNKDFGCDNPLMESPVTEACQKFPEQMKELCRQVPVASTSQQPETNPETSNDLPPLPAMDETEAGGACNTPACLQTEDGTQETVNVMTQMCMEALPEHCQQVQPKFTACTPTDDMSWGQISGLSTGSCITGLWDGIVDTAWFFGRMAKGLGVTAWKSLTTDGYSEEVMDMGSFMMEDLQNTNKEDVKELFERGFWNEADKFINCLNTRGRYEYLCEGASQVVVGGVSGYGIARGTGWVGQKVMNTGRRIRWRARGGRGGFPKLTRKEKRAQKSTLRNMLNLQDELDVEKLTPFMLSLLSKKQFKTRVNFSNLTDAQAMHLSKRRLSQIHPTEYAKMNITKLPKTIDRMPDEGFKALMSQTTAQIPIASVQKNLYRIPPAQISNIKNIHKVDPGVFRRKMTRERLHGLTPNQAQNVKSGPQYHRLTQEQKKIVDDIIDGPPKNSLTTEKQVRLNEINEKISGESAATTTRSTASTTPSTQHVNQSTSSGFMPASKPSQTAAGTNKALPRDEAIKAKAHEAAGGRSFIDEPAAYRTAKKNAKEAREKADTAWAKRKENLQLSSDKHSAWLKGENPFETATQSRAKQEIAKYDKEAMEAFKDYLKYSTEAKKYEKQAVKIATKVYEGSKVPAKAATAAKNAGRVAGSQGGKN